LGRRTRKGSLQSSVSDLKTLIIYLNFAGPKFLFAQILIFDAAIFGVLRHSGVKIEAYTVAQAA
jgi:hypothetical protein